MIHIITITCLSWSRFLVRSWAEFSLSVNSLLECRQAAPDKMENTMGLGYFGELK